MNDRIRIIVGILLLTITASFIAFIIYWFLFRNPPAIVDTGQETEVTDNAVGGLTGSGESDGTATPDAADQDDIDTLVGSEDVITDTPVQLTSSPVTSATLTADGTVAYYDSGDGRFYTIDENGNIVLLSSTQFPDAETIVFSGDAEMVAIEFPDGSNVLYNFEEEEQITMPSHWEEFSFSGDSDEVISKNITVDPSNNSLVVTSTDGSHTEIIADLGTNADKVTIDWSPDSDVVGFSQTGRAQTGFGREQIFLIGTDGEALGYIIVEGLAFSSSWSPSGDTLLYSVADASKDFRPTLWSVDVSGNDIGTDRDRYGIETWVEKCTFQDESTVYCAVPREIENNEGLDTDSIDSPDDVYRLDLDSGLAILIASPDLDYHMFNLSVTEDGETLYFTNERGYLNRISLQ